MNAGIAFRPFVFLATKTETVGDFTVIFRSATKIYFKILNILIILAQFILQTDDLSGLTRLNQATYLF